MSKANSSHEMAVASLQMQPTRSELRERLGEDTPFSLLQDLPVDAAFLCWALDEAGATTTEPPRSGTLSCWHRRISAA